MDGDSDMAIDIVEALPGMELARGYDFPKDDPKILQAVEGKAGKIPKAKGQVSAEYDFMIVRSVSDFQQALGVDANVGINVGFAGGSAKTSFEEKCKVTSEATFCLVSFRAINAPISLRGEVKLTDEALRLLQLKDTKRFRQRYGTHFCSDIFTGVEFFGSIRIDADSTEQEMDIAASINARYGPAKGSVSTKFAESSLSSNYRMEIFTFQSGGIMRPVLSLDELFETGKRVAKQGSKGLATATQIVLGTYDELELPLDGASDFSQEHVKKEMRRLKNLYNQLRQTRNDIDFVLANPDKYVSFDKKKMLRQNARITESLALIVDLSDQCASDFSTYKSTEPDVPVVELPERKRGARSRIRLKKQNRLLRARTKEQRARILANKADDLPDGARKTRLLEEAKKLRHGAKVLREKAAIAGKIDKPKSDKGKGRKKAVKSQAGKRTSRKRRVA
jgi:hypothetical protein